MIRRDKLLPVIWRRLSDDRQDLLLAKRFIQGQIGIIQTEDEMLAEVVNLGRRRSPA